MEDIDFIPLQYRQKHVRRQSQPWRIIVVVAFVVLLATAVFTQQGRKREVGEELAAILPQYDLAVRQNGRLAQLHAQLKTARTAAELYTYLRHPWPHTQLLAALLAPLPKEITLQQVQITGQMPQDQAPTARYSRTEREAKDDELAKLPPAARDLKRLRDQLDKMGTVVLIVGTTSQSASLHRYLGELGSTSLFSKAELDSLESSENSSEKDGGQTLEFHATLAVRPGYGQPGGPVPLDGLGGPEENAVAQTDHESRVESEELRVESLTTRH